MPAAETAVSRKAGHINERLQVLERLTKESTQLLDVLGSSLNELSRVTAPIHARATALTAAQRNIADTKEAVDKLLEHLDTSRRVAPILEAGPVRDLGAFLDALSQLEASTDFLVQHNELAAVRAALEHSQSVFNRALESCDADFRSTLTAGTRSSAPPAAWISAARQEYTQGCDPADVIRDLVPPSLLPKLRRMVELMMQADYTPAQQGYVASRGRALQQVLQESRLDVAPTGQLALLPPEQLERTMATWGHQLISLTLLLISEQKLVIDIWPSPFSRQLFARLSQPFLAALLASGHELVDARKSPDKLFALLEMHGQLSLALPLLDEMLGDSTAVSRGSSPGSVTSAAAIGEVLEGLRGLLRLVASASLGPFGEYEASVARDGNKMLPMDGTIHPLTAQVLSYLKRLLSYSCAADVLYGVNSQHASQPSPSDDDYDSGYNQTSEGGQPRHLTRPQAGLSAGIARLLTRLTSNLEAKSRGYKNEPLAALFMMNNVHYVQWSVENSPAALELLGVDWLERHKDVVEEWGARYHNMTWMPLVDMLRADPPEDPIRLKAVLKETYNQFNAAIESIYTNQSGWTIPDHTLRVAVKRVIKDDLLGPYQDFLRRHADVDFTTNPAKYIKYSAADVASIIDDDLFETKAVSMNKHSLQKEKLGAIV